MIPRSSSVPFVLSVSLLLLSACSDAAPPPAPPNPPGGDVGPMVTAVFPTAQALGADPATGILLTLDAPVDPASVSGATVKAIGRWSGTHPGIVQTEQNDTRIRFTPTTPFSAGEWVTVLISAGVRGADGGPLAQGYAWNFWTRAGPGTLHLTPSGQFSVRRSGEGRIQTYGAYGGDLDGDGALDLMLPNEQANDARIFLGDGAGGFGSVMVFPIPGGAVPSTNEGVDFNGDGRLDFAIGNSGSDLVSVFLGADGPDFAHRGNFRADRGVRGLCVLDIEGDADFDIVTANRDDGGTVSLLVNDGTGGFVRSDNQDTGAGGETACAVADADQDGILDVFVGAIESGELLLLRGNGRGGLILQSRISVGGGPWMLAAGDLNGDGHVDVVSANTGENTFSVILGDGAGGLQATRSYDVGDMPIAIDLGDVDGDGDLDVVTSNFGTADWTLYESLGDGTFLNPRTLGASSAASCAVLHDRDNDGDLDLTGIDELDDLVFLFDNR